MAKTAPEDPNRRDSLAREVDRLLGKLPGADPYLRGDSPSQPAPGVTPRALGAAAEQTGRVPDRASVPSTPPLAVWARVALGVLLGVGLVAWPYEHECGFPLFGYLAAVFVLLLVAGWVGIAAWKRRMAIAHVIALVLGFWGVVLAAEQILPRIGYAAERATWGCPAPAPRPPAPRPTVTPPSD